MSFPILSYKNKLDLGGIWVGGLSCFLSVTSAYQLWSSSSNVTVYDCRVSNLSTIKTE